MNARRPLLAALVSLSTCVVGGLVATPAAFAEEICPNAASRQGPSAALPDCRAYELLTPPNKGDAQDMFPDQEEGSPMPETAFAAEDGDHVVLNAASPFEEGDSFLSSYVFSRGAGGWTTTSLSPGAGLHGLKTEAFNAADLSEVAVQDLELKNEVGSPETQATVTYFGAPAGPFITISSDLPTNFTRVAGASADLSKIVLSSEDHELAPGDTGQDSETNAVYEWAGGHVRLVNVATDGSLISPCGAELGMGSRFTYAGSGYHAVSNDGTKVIFTAPSGIAHGGAGCWNQNTSPEENPPQLYMRLNGSTTTEISLPNAGVSDPSGSHPAIYVGASANGTKVFFLTQAELTADDVTHAPELYEYNTEAPEGDRLVRISSGESGTAEGDVDFIGGVSSDGSTVYFTAYGKLAAGATALPGASSEPLVNLYRYDTATRTTTYIAKIDSLDYPPNGGTQPNWPEIALANDGHAHPYEVALDASADWYTTADGQYLLFPTSQPLTGYENKSAPFSGPGCSQSVYGGSEPRENRCVELFRYHAANNSVVCVSCANGAPIDNALFARHPYESDSAAPPRAISEDGAYVFFETENALVPQTTTGKAHVYEWHEGKISLISSADDVGSSYFMGSSADGSNVFFGTHAQLVPQDTDVMGDLYDARIDGGFVKLTKSLCTGTGCQGVPASPPIFATPSSVTFEGVGNFTPSPLSAVKMKTKVKKLTRGQKRAKALRACRQEHSKRKRARCEASARARYGRTQKSITSNRRGS